VVITGVAFALVVAITAAFDYGRSGVQQFTSNVEVKAVIADLMKPKPQPTSAQTPSTPAPSTRIGNTDELLREFNQLAVHPTRNEKRLGEIEKTLKAAGVW
jgi:hypothetical protein